MIVQKTGQVACHIRIRDVAKRASGHLYENLMSNNEMFDKWKKQNPDCTPKELERRFIEKNWPKCIEFARATLALMLRQDDISDKIKEQVMDILEKDQLLRYRTSMTRH